MPDTGNTVRRAGERTCDVSRKKKRQCEDVTILTVPYAITRIYEPNPFAKTIVVPKLISAKSVTRSLPTIAERTHLPD